jgi:7-cyano-7-deazaguanine synthase
MKRAFVLLSGGIDSTTCLHKAIFDAKPSHLTDEDIYRIIHLNHNFQSVDWVEAISVDYGQRHLKETEYAKATCELYGIEHTILNLRDILAGDSVMLTDKNVAIPDIDYADIKGVSPTYVPFRNGTLLSLITAHAQKWVNAEIAKRVDNLLADDEPYYTSAKIIATGEAKDSVGIYFGAHAEDAANWAYPDCTPEFIGAMANAIFIGSYQAIRLYTPLQWLGKKEIIQLGESLSVDWSGTWSCYAGGDLHCGTCPTCRARRAGFIAAEVGDPTNYALTGTRAHTIVQDDDIPF